MDKIVYSGQETIAREKAIHLLKASVHIVMVMDAKIALSILNIVADD